jgi:CDP-4-dehydro-6-deoxyglucose reductase
MTTWYDSKIIQIEDASPTTRRIWVRVPGAEVFQFKAGQFVTMDLPIGEKRLQRWRSYSIAIAPDESNILEFCIVRLAGGIASNYLFTAVKKGSILRFKGPEGGFILPENIDKDLVMICTGTGVAPFRSMLTDLQKRQMPHKNIHLIFGTRYQDGILYMDEFRKMTQHMPGFKYSIALSKEQHIPVASDGIEIRQGYVHQFYLEHYSPVRSDVLFLICGWTKMIDEAVANLIKMGYDRTQIRYEVYG